jgi:hypothetical protein
MYFIIGYFIHRSISLDEVVHNSYYSVTLYKTDVESIYIYALMIRGQQLFKSVEYRSARVFELSKVVLFH